MQPTSTNARTQYGACPLGKELKSCDRDSIRDYWPGLMGREFASAVARWIHLSNLDGKWGMAPWRTWDNATIFGEVEPAYQRHRFPITFHTKRIAPGES